MRCGMAAGQPINQTRSVTALADRIPPIVTLSPVSNVTVGPAGGAPGAATAPAPPAAAIRPA
jgi:hypothetical protein